MQELAELRATLTTRYTELQTNQQEWQAQLQVAHEHNTALEQAHAESLAEAQQRYEGLSKQLLQETAQQRQTQQPDSNRLTPQLKFAERRIASVQTTAVYAKTDLSQLREFVDASFTVQTMNWFA